MNVDALQNTWNELRRNPPLQWWVGILFGAVLAAILIGAFFNSRVLYLAAGAFVGFPLVAIMSRYPQAWIFSVVALHAVWLRTSDKGLSLVEIAIVGFFFGSLSLWFLWQFVVKRKRLVRHAGDLLILIAAGLAVLNLGVAYYREVLILEWFRQFLLWAMILYYFPIREYITTDKRLRILFYILLGVFCVVGVQTVQAYIRATTDIVYAYELVSARSALTEMALVAATIGCAGALLFARRLISNIFSLGLTVFFFSCLVATFSRSFWAATMMSLGMLYFFSRARQRAKILVMSLIGVVIAIFGILTFVGEDKAELFLVMLQTRFESIFSPTKSVSLEARGSESAELVKLIPESPMLGFGFGATFMFYDPIFNTYAVGNFIHNGYLYLAFKLGIPTALLFLAGLIIHLWRAIPLFRRVHDPLLRYALMVSFACLCAELMVSYFGNQFAFREGVFLYAINLALISIVERRVDQIETGGKTLERVVPLLPASRQKALQAASTTTTL